MKIINKILVVMTIAFMQFSCDEGEVFTGAPDSSKLQFETLQGTISTSENSVVSGQQFPVTVSIPQAFDVDVNVEVIAFLSNINKRTRRTFTVMAGDTSVDGLMTAPSGDQGSVILPFNQELTVYLSAINSKPAITPDGVAPLGFAGKQYTITSNTLTLDYGDSFFAGVNSNRLAIRLDWANPPGGGNPIFNNLNIRLKRDENVITITANTQTPIHGTTTSSARYESLNFLSTALDGTYIIEIFAAKLTSSTTPVDVPYRFTVRFPDESVRTFSGILVGMTVGSAATAIPKLQIVKTTVGTDIQYTITGI